MPPSPSLCFEHSGLICYATSIGDVFNINPHNGLGCNPSIEGIHSGKVSNIKRRGQRWRKEAGCHRY